MQALGADTIYPKASGAAAKTEDISFAAARGSYDWLRLYFEEVIWPFEEKVATNVETQSKAHAEAKQTLRVHKVDGDAPVDEVSHTARRIMSSAFRTAILSQDA